jgi:hypothetical protein
VEQDAANQASRLREESPLFVSKVALATLALASSAHALTIPTTINSDSFHVEIGTSDPAQPNYSPVHLLTADVPWSLTATGQVDTDALLWTIDSISISSRPTGSLNASYGPMHLVGVYDPPGFNPPVQLEQNGVELSASFVWGALQLGAGPYSAPPHRPEQPYGGDRRSDRLW